MPRVVQDQPVVNKPEPSAPAPPMDKIRPVLILEIVEEAKISNSRTFARDSAFSEGQPQSWHDKCMAGVSASAGYLRHLSQVVCIPIRLEKGSQKEHTRLDGNIGWIDKAGLKSPDRIHEGPRKRIS